VWWWCVWGGSMATELAEEEGAERRHAADGIQNGKLPPATLLHIESDPGTPALLRLHLSLAPTPRAHLRACCTVFSTTPARRYSPFCATYDKEQLAR
jgi:hypothetical protein